MHKVNFGSCLRDRRRLHLGVVWGRWIALSFILAVVASFLVGCVQFPRPPRPAVFPEIFPQETRTPQPTPTIEPAPRVTVAVSRQGVVRSGQDVAIRVQAGSAAQDLRLAIDGADTGWQARERLPEATLVYTWTAGEAGTYEILGQARTAGGTVGERQRPIVVAPYSPSNSGQGSSIRETEITLPTYPMEAYQRSALDATYQWPYLAFDRDSFWAESPAPELRTYRLLLLENEFLQVSILPEWGGRIWQVIHKPSGNAMFYQNAVIKPSPWGPVQQSGWLALGGLEWALPVNEHGYDWGTSWQVSTFQEDGGAVGARIATPDDGRLLAAEIAVTLPPNAAYLQIAPTLRSNADTALDFHYWQTAMLAPGPDNQPGQDLRFVVPGRMMTVHSSGDKSLPAPGHRFPWPHFRGRDLSRLGNWQDYLGFFEYPAAHGPFVGVYDPAVDAGAVRVYPATIVRGSKVFGLGWRERIGSEHFTDDQSYYVELHGGLSPSFFVPYTLPAGEQVAWQEVWYPVQDIGGFVYANGTAALNLTKIREGWQVDIHGTVPLVGTVRLSQGEQEIGQAAFRAHPDAPAALVLETPDGVTRDPSLPLQVEIKDRDGKIILAYTASRS